MARNTHDDPPASLRLATRGSPLALVQANWVADQLRRAWPKVAVELVIVESAGDQQPDVSLSTLSGQGIFVKEIQAAVLEGRADVAVHSAKDLPGESHATLTLAAIPHRADPRDALVGKAFLTLPHGARVGTGSGRRVAQLANRRRDLKFVSVRGNMARRLSLVGKGEVDALVVAVAAFERLGWSEQIASIFSISEMLPQVGQGALALECRRDDNRTAAALFPLVDLSSQVAVLAERAYLRAIGGDCSAPIGCHAQVVGRTLVMEGLVASRDGSVVIRVGGQGRVSHPEALGARVGKQILSGLGATLVATGGL